jgi:hypothetical protein
MPRLSRWSIVRVQTSKRRAISRLPTQAPPAASLGCLGSRGRAGRVECHGCWSVRGIRRVSPKLAGRTVGVGLPRAVSGGRWQSSAIANRGAFKNPNKRWWRRRELKPGWAFRVSARRCDKKPVFIGRNAHSEPWVPSSEIAPKRTKTQKFCHQLSSMKPTPTAGFRSRCRGGAETGFQGDDQGVRCQRREARMARPMGVRRYRWRRLVGLSGSVWPRAPEATSLAMVSWR